jgi:hypothetical protein
MRVSSDGSSAQQPANFLTSCKVVTASSTATTTAAAAVVSNAVVLQLTVC